MSQRKCVILSQRDINTIIERLHYPKLHKIREVFYRAKNTPAENLDMGAINLALHRANNNLIKEGRKDIFLNKKQKIEELTERHSREMMELMSSLVNTEEVNNEK